MGLFPKKLDEEDIEQIEMILKIKHTDIQSAHAQQYLNILFDWYNKVISLNPVVVKSVCICGSEKPYKKSRYEEGYEYCTKCFKSRRL